jgi:uncharacterized membrane protein
MMILMMLMPLAMMAGLAFFAWMGRGALGFRPHGGRVAQGDGRPQDDRQGGTAPEDPLAVVRDRYARGEITHEELDRYLDRLLATDPKLGRLEAPAGSMDSVVAKGSSHAKVPVARRRR